MRLQILCPVPPVKRPRRLIVRAHIHTDPQRIALPKPFRQSPKQRRSHAFPPVFRNHRDPFQLPLAVMAEGQMPGNKAHKRTPIQSRVHHPFFQRMLRVNFPTQISRNAPAPIFLIAPVLGANLSQPRNILKISQSVIHHRCIPSVSVAERVRPRPCRDRLPRRSANIYAWHPNCRRRGTPGSAGIPAGSWVSFGVRRLAAAFTV
jgi:hypothetical protein